MASTVAFEPASSLPRPVSVALILAAGLGSRLRPLTFERPKPLVEVLGFPLVYFALEKAHRLGVERIAINTHHLGERLRAEVGTHFKGTPITYAAEENLLGTGGGIRNLAEQLGGIPTTFAVMNADALVDLDLRDMASAHAGGDFSATLALKDTPDKNSFGLIGTDEDDQIRTFAGRTRYRGPVDRERMFCGVHLIEPNLLERLPVGRDSCINQIGYPPLLDEGGAMLGFDVPGYFCDVGTPERLFEANLLLVSGKTKFRHFDPFAAFQRHEDDEGNPIYLSADLRLPSNWQKRFRGPLLIDAGTTIAPDAYLGPFAVVGKNCRIGAKVRLARAVLQSGAEVQAGQAIENEVWGHSCTIPIDPEKIYTF